MPRGHSTNTSPRVMRLHTSHCHSGRSKLPCNANTTMRGVLMPSGNDTTASRKPGTANDTSGVAACKGASAGGGVADALGVVGGWQLAVGSWQLPLQLQSQLRSRTRVRATFAGLGKLRQARGSTPAALARRAA